MVLRIDVERTYGRAAAPQRMAGAAPEWGWSVSGSEKEAAVPITLEPGPSAMFLATTLNATQVFVAGVSGVVIENLP
jgi:hypothetical protein